MSEPKAKTLNPTELLALRGLRLPRLFLKDLERAGIRSDPAVSLQYQKPGKEYVIRGSESGGAIEKLGAYCGYTGANGQRLSWAHRQEDFRPNRVHGSVTQKALVRIQMVRNAQHYILLITRHDLVTPIGRKTRPGLQNRVLFHSSAGLLEMDLWGSDRTFAGQVAPAFTADDGQAVLIPEAFLESVKQVTIAVNCIQCTHCHLLSSPGSEQGA